MSVIALTITTTLLALTEVPKATKEGPDTKATKEGPDTRATKDAPDPGTTKEAPKAMNEAPDARATTEAPKAMKEDVALFLCCKQRVNQWQLFVHCSEECRKGVCEAVT